MRFPFLVYLLLLGAALIFTQALVSPLSAVMFVLALLLPICSLLYALLARMGLKVSAECSRHELPKRTPVSFRLTLSNESPLPLPFAELELLLPSDASAVRCVESRASISLAPFGVCRLERNIEFFYRGEYELGVTRAFVYDLFRMFRIAADVSSIERVFVTPRRLVKTGDSDVAASDVNSDSSKSVAGVDRSEISDIRDYRFGDHMKDIHWKLSSKRQELITREFSMNSGNTSYVFVDLVPLTAAVPPETALTAAFPKTGEPDAGTSKNGKNGDKNGAETAEDDFYADDADEYAADGVIELAVAVALRELRSGNSCTLIWYDARAEGGVMISSMQTPADLSQCFKLFSTAPIIPAEDAESKRVAGLTALAEETHAVAMLFVTAALTTALTDGLTGAAAAYGSVFARGAAEVCLFDPSDKVSAGASREAFEDYTKRCVEQLTAASVKLIATKLDNIKTNESN